MKSTLSGGPFRRNALTLVTGTTIAQAIPIAISPILTRLYSPDDFGLMALYLSIVTVLSILATARYELAIMLPPQDEEARQLTILTFIITACVSLVLFLIVLMFAKPITVLLGAPGIQPWLYLVPVSVLLTGIYQGLNFWLNRNKLYGDMSKNRIVQSATTASANTAMGAAGLGASGLILGSVLGQTVATAMIGRRFLSTSPRFDVRSVYSVARSYSSHPKYLLPSHMIGAANSNFVVFFLTAVFGAVATGYFSLASRLMALPTTLISTAVGDVFRQRATEQYHQTGEFRALWLKTFKYMFGLSVLPFFAFASVAPTLFVLVFGDNWRDAGEYAQVLTVQFFFGFLFAALDKSALIVGANRYIFWWHLTRLAANVVIAVIAFGYSIGIENYLYLLVAVNVFFYTLDLFVEFKLSGRSSKAAQRKAGTLVANGLSDE